jgi:hypothetical protein
MNQNILNTLQELEKFDENWNQNIELLQKEIQYINPNIYKLIQEKTIEEVYHLIIDYKPIILNSINDKQKLKKLYNDCLNYNEEKFSCEEMLYLLELAFGNKFNSDYLYYPEEIENDREIPFSFEEFYQNIYK